MKHAHKTITIDGAIGRRHYNADAKRAAKLYIKACRKIEAVNRGRIRAERAYYLDLLHLVSEMEG